MAKNSICSKKTILLICFLLCSLSFVYSNSAEQLSKKSSDAITTMISRSILLQPGEYQYIHYSSQNKSLNPYFGYPLSLGLSSLVIKAIAKTPLWIQPMLTTQFKHITHPEPYAQLILNASLHHTDEIAFIIAASALGKVPSVQIIKKNVQALYRNDKLVQYAKILDINSSENDYYSTIQYHTLENEIPRDIILPKDIYYWFIVHPEMVGENAVEIYGEIWRDYLVHHNDIGYPLLKEKIQNIHYLWDGKSYFQPKNRLWNWSLSQHPTAVEVISYWIGKTVPYSATGTRPGQPQKIAHEHNGWCGELQRLAIAAQRSLLIPSAGASNIAEDHVWREFYEQGWHENDNWWNDGGGAVDKPDVYAYGWGKNMSSIYSFRGDDAIYQVTKRYIHDEDRVTITFSVKDLYQQPVDGARVVALVKGIKDITWYKLLIWEKIEGLWEKIPDFLKGTVLKNIFSKLESRFEEIPNIVDGPAISVWNYTDATGICQLTLGKNLEYMFLIQAGHLKKPWQFARHNSLRFLKNPCDKTYNILFADLSNRPYRFLNKDYTDGKTSFSVQFSSIGTQLHSHPLIGDIGRYPSKGSIQVFMVDAENFARFQDGRIFRCLHSLKDASVQYQITIDDKDIFWIVYNPTRTTMMNVNITLVGYNPNIGSYIDFFSPTSMIFSHPYYPLGSSIPIEGVASEEVLLTIHNKTYNVSVQEGKFLYVWNTSLMQPGEYEIIGKSGIAEEHMCVSLVDNIPPRVIIEHPSEYEIIENDTMYISGKANDNFGITSLTIRVGNQTSQNLQIDNNSWEFTADISAFPLGAYTITVIAKDNVGLETKDTCIVMINESGHSWGPQINTVYHSPEFNITVTDNVVIYGNITMNSPFPIKAAHVCYSNGSQNYVIPMFLYGAFPEQERHWEDPLVNLSNKPRYGCELGQLSSGTYSYVIESYDMAYNRKISDEYSFTVEEES